MHKIITAVIVAILSSVSFALADVDVQSSETLEKKTTTEEAICRNILDADQHVEGEKFIAKEVITIASKKILVFVCGITDPFFEANGDGKYANAVLVNKNGINFSIAKLKKIVDTYQKDSWVIMHIVVDPVTLLNEISTE